MRRIKKIRLRKFRNNPQKNKILYFIKNRILNNQPILFDPSNNLIFINYIENYTYNDNPNLIPINEKTYDIINQKILQNMLKEDNISVYNNTTSDMYMLPVTKHYLENDIVNLDSIVNKAFNKLNYKEQLELLNKMLPDPLFILLYIHDCRFNHKYKLELENGKDYWYE